jgi:hypothetical protein
MYAMISIVYQGTTTLGKKVSIMTFSMTIKKCDTQHDDTQNNDNAFAECCYAECHNKVHYVECCYAECHYAEYRGAFLRAAVVV